MHGLQMEMLTQDGKNNQNYKIAKRLVSFLQKIFLLHMLKLGRFVSVSSM